MSEALLGFLTERCLEDLDKFKSSEETMYVTSAYGWRAFEDVFKNLANNPSVPEESLKKIAEIDFEGGGIIAEEIQKAAMENIRTKPIAA